MSYKIQKHEFSDRNVELSAIRIKDRSVTFATFAPFHELDRQDVIALAKHFQLTKKELK